MSIIADWRAAYINRMRAYAEWTGPSISVMIQRQHSERRRLRAAYKSARCAERALWARLTDRQQKNQDAFKDEQFNKYLLSPMKEAAG
jgi:hypothetical protein